MASPKSFEESDRRESSPFCSKKYLIPLSVISTITSLALAVVVIVLVMKYSQVNSELRSVMSNCSQVAAKLSCLERNIEPIPKCDSLRASYGALNACRVTTICNPPNNFN